MKIYHKSSKHLAITLFSALLLGTVFVVIESSDPTAVAVPMFSAKDVIGVQPVASASPDETNTPNPNPPDDDPKGEFVPLLNAYYNCWKHGDCWSNSSDWISITAIVDVASIYACETATCTLSLTASEGFTAPVTFTLQGEPSGVTASFAPNPVTPPGTNQLYITTAASTVAGTYPMTVTGTSGVVSDTARLTLTVNQMSITNLISDSPVEVNRGMHFTATVSGTPPITYVWDFGGPGSGSGTDEATPVYTYTAAGTYTVTLIVTNACGTASDFTVMAIVSSIPAFPGAEGVRSELCGRPRRQGD